MGTRDVDLRMGPPLLLNHDHTRAIGTIVTNSGRLRIRLDAGRGLTRAQLFEVFGNCGIVVLETEWPKGPTDQADGGAIIREFEILEWSFQPLGPAQPG